MQLSHAQKNELYVNGFTIVPGAVSRLQIDAAMRAINHSLGEGIPAEEITRIRSQSYCSELTSTSLMTGLFNDSTIRPLLESALGPDSFSPVGGMQIAIRFPVMADPPPVPNPHIDGIWSPHNGVKKGVYANSTALVGLYLSDVMHRDMGNFTVWPGSHRQNQQYFREHGTEILLERTPPLDWPEPVQICARAGDAIICHYTLGHGISANISPYPRYAGFFRITHKEQHQHPLETLTDIWLDWHGMRDTVAAAAT